MTKFTLFVCWFRNKNLPDYWRLIDKLRPITNGLYFG